MTQPELGPGVHQPVVDLQRVFRRYIQFPAQFTDIGHPHGQHPGVININIAPMEVGKGLMGDVLVGHRGQQCPGIGPMDIDLGV